MIPALIAVVVIALLVRRRLRRNTLAGLNSDKPSFSIAPPRRWSTNLKDHTL